MVYRKINFLLPSYKRVAEGRLPKFFQSALVMADSIGNICFTFFVNEEDAETRVYLDEAIKLFHDTHIIVGGKDVTDPPNLARFFNILHRGSRFRGDDVLVSMVGDDMVFATKGYDTKILQKINEIDGVGMVYCDDDYMQHQNLCVNLFTTERMIAATGKPFMCEMYPVDFIDTVWDKVTKRLGIAYYLPDVKIRHEHAGGTATYNRLRAMYPVALANVGKFDAYVDEIVRSVVTSGILKL